ncbi:MAG TPA: TonB family protein [Verrucomicrobiae bacterium]
MNRLQKRCVIGTAGIHLLLLTILIFGPAFFNRQPKTDNTVLDVIPANLVDAALNSGVQGAQAPPPTPAVIPPSLLRPPPPLPAPTPEPKVVQPTPPAPAPSPSLLEQFEIMFRQTKPTPTVSPDMKEVRKTEKSHDDVKVDLNKVTRKDFSKRNPKPDNTSDTKAINSALTSLRHNMSSATKINMPGTGTAASASFNAVLQSIYLRAIVANLPAQLAHNDEHTMVKVTIARDGTVISSSIVSPSGDSAWDNAVQRTLDQVTVVHAFPDSWTEQQRTFSLDFNPQAAKEFQ